MADFPDAQVPPRSYIERIPVRQRYVSRLSLDKIFENKKRNRGIVIAHQEYRYKQKEIAEHLGLHYSTVSNIIKKGGHGNSRSKTRPQKRERPDPKSATTSRSVTFYLTQFVKLTMKQALDIIPLAKPGCNMKRRDFPWSFGLFPAGPFEAVDRPVGLGV